MIYIYGTCWSNPRIDAHLWTNIVRKHFKCQATNYSFTGVSFEWCFSKIDRTKHLWKPEDVILFTEPDLDRKWFFKRYPGIAQAHRISRTERLSQQDKDFALLWLEKYYNPKVEFLNLKAHYHMMNQSIKDANARGFVIQGFDRPAIDDMSHLLFSVGKSMAHISKHEYISPDKWWQDWDNRINHISKENHLILAQQVAKAIKTNSNIDLTVDFKESFHERTSKI